MLQVDGVSRSRLLPLRDHIEDLVLLARLRLLLVDVGRQETGGSSLGLLRGREVLTCLLGRWVACWGGGGEGCGGG